MGLPDPQHSRVVLVGVHKYATLEDLPAVRNNIKSLEEIFTGKESWGLPREHCVSLLQPSRVEDILDTIGKAAVEADDSLLIYFAGHGLPDPHTDELYLALGGSSSERLYSALRFEYLRRAVMDPAVSTRRKIVIIDSCFSGRALRGSMGAGDRVAAEAEISGTCVLTATAESHMAISPPDEHYTAFTGELIRALTDGIPGEPELLDMNTVYRHLRAELAVKSRPLPQQRDRNTGGLIVLSRNRAVLPTADKDSGADADESATTGTRTWRTRTRLAALLIAMIVGTSFGIWRLIPESPKRTDHMGALTNLTGKATLLADALQEERDVSAGPITRGQPKDHEVVASRQDTDKAWEAFSAASDELPKGGDELALVRTKISEIENELQTLKRIRETAYDNPDFIAITVSSYNQLINSLLSLPQDMPLDYSNSDVLRSVRALSAFSSAKEFESMQRAIIAAALANEKGPQLSPSDRAFGQSAADSEDGARSRFAQAYGQGASELTRSLDGGIVEIKLADEFRTRSWESANGIKGQDKTSLDWFDQASVKIQEMDKIQAHLLEGLEQQVRPKGG